MKNDINHPQKGLDNCAHQSPLQREHNSDPAPKNCSKDPGVNSLNRLLEECDDNQKTGHGKAHICDDMLSGKILNDTENPNRNTIYRYSKGIRGTDEAMMDLFRDVVVLDEDGKAHGVPIIWATQEKAVAAVVQDNVRKDETLVVNRIKLPMMAISSTDMQYNQDRFTFYKATDWLRNVRGDGKPGFAVKEKYERDTVFGFARGVPVDISYTLYIWTLYVEDMNQIMEQIVPKINPEAYIRVRGISWEIPVKMSSIGNNMETEPGDQAIRVLKYQINLTAETYIPQPIVRRKAVLKTNIDIVDGLSEEDIKSVTSRLEESVGELEC